MLFLQEGIGEKKKKVASWALKSFSQVLLFLSFLALKLWTFVFFLFFFYLLALTLLKVGEILNLAGLL